jgi:aspartyl-tRNA(Asn)/glutamyl-tRNA(Gln) amidotransferase subunit A
MARTPADAALLLRVLAGYDPNDPATVDEPLGDLDAALRDGLQDCVVGICPDLHVVQLAPDVQAVFDEAVRVTESLCRRIEEVRLPEAPTIYPTFGVVQRAEAHFTHTEAGLYPARAADYGADVLGRLERAAGETALDYLRGSAQRQRIRAAFDRLFREVDVLLTPVSAGPPPPIGEEERVSHLGSEIEFRELVMTYTTPHDLVGIPTCTVRAGFDALGAPVGVQFAAAPWADARAVGAGHAFFEATPHVQERWPEPVPTTTRPRRGR